MKYPRIITIILLTFLAQSDELLGQRYLEMMEEPSKYLFEDIVEEYRDFARGKSPSDIPRYKQFNRWVMNHSNHLQEDGRIANASVRNYRAYKRVMKNAESNRAPGGLFTEIGPTSYTLGVHGTAQGGGMGMVNCVAFDPVNGDRVLIGTAAGGLWESTANGVGWTPLTDGLPVLGVSGIAIETNNTNRMYILTGDGDGSDTYSMGVLKTYNGGLTWQNTDQLWNVDEQVRAYKLLMHPTQDQTLFIASSDGIYKTTNGGTDWLLEETGHFTDIEFNPGNPDIMYAVSRVPGAGTGDFYFSTNNGDTWLQYNGSQLPTNGFTRIAIGVTPDFPNLVYLLYGGGVTGFAGLYQSTNSGGNWTMQSNTPNIMGKSTTGNDSVHQAGYDIALAIDPTDYTNLYVGGLNVWQSTDEGVTWAIIADGAYESNPFGYVHYDIHALEWSGSELWCGTDGGIYRSDNAGADWIDLTEGLAIRQFYHIDYEDGYVIGGTQDNGTSRWHTSTTVGQIVLGSDGMECILHPDNPDIWYLSSQSNRWKTTNGGATSAGFYIIDPPPGTSDTINDIWQSDWIMDPTDPDRMFMSEHDVYRTEDGGSTWSLVLNWQNGIRIRGLAQGIDDNEVLYAAKRVVIQRSQDAVSGNPPSWVPVTYDLPVATTRPINAIAVDPDSAQKVWICMGGYTDDTKVFMLDEGSTSWENKSFGLPNVPVIDIVYEPGSNNGLYVGTDIGIFYTNDSFSGWIPYMNGLPSTPVRDLHIEDGWLFAGTHGRGIWRSPLFSTCSASLNLTQANDPSNPNSTGVQLYEASTSIVSTREISGGVGTNVTYQSGGWIRLDPGFEIKTQNELHALIDGCSQQ